MDALHFADSGEDHRIFWGVIRPIEDKFWNEHRPGIVGIANAL